MRCPEDYALHKSNAKNDYYRKWYHTRSRFATVSLDQLVEGQDSSSVGDATNAVLGDFVKDPAANFEEVICNKID